MNYWIQRADFQAEDLSASSAREVQDRFRRHDWAGEQAYRESLESGGRECCSPGLGVVAADGRILHLCPDGDGMLCHYHYPETRRVLGVFRRQSQATLTWDDVPASASHLIELFFDGRHDDLVEHGSRAGWSPHRGC